MDKIESEVRLNISPYVIPGIEKKGTLINNTMMEKVLKELCFIYDVQPEKVRGASREATLVYVRFLYCYWLRSVFGKNITLSRIARFLNRDHTTVLHGIRTFQDFLKINQIASTAIKTGFSTVQEDYYNTNKILKQCL